MKTKIPIIAATSLLVIAAGIFVLVKNNEETRATTGQSNPETPMGNRDSTSREERYIDRGVTIAEYTQWLERDLQTHDNNPRIIQGTLDNLSLVGTSEAIRIMKEYLQKNEAHLPDPPPTKEQLGDASAIERRMDVADPATPEGKSLRAVINLIASGTSEGRLIVNDFVRRVKTKYSNAYYGEIFLKQIDLAVREGEATIELNERHRKLYNL